LSVAASPKGVFPGVKTWQFNQMEQISFGTLMWTYFPFTTLNCNHCQWVCTGSCTSDCVLCCARMVKLLTTILCGCRTKLIHQST